MNHKGKSSENLNHENVFDKKESLITKICPESEKNAYIIIKDT